MRRLPHWLVSMFVGLLAVAVLGSLGAPALVALLGGVAAGFVAHRSRRDPPWTAAGRRRGRDAWRGARDRTRALRRWWVDRSRSRRPFGGGRSSPEGGWPGGPGSSWTEPRVEEPEPIEPRGSVVTVRCEIVTDRLQVWHSTDTGRAYEVPRERGLPSAAPGDLGSLTFEGGRPRVTRRAVN
jgi:hypothetical protein